MMTKQQSLEICRDMWRWLEKNPEAQKDDFLLAHPETPRLHSQCSCCQYVKERAEETNSVFDCNLCPLKEFWLRDVDVMQWYGEETTTEGGRDYCMDSTYRKWCNEHNPEKRAALAKLIADAAEEQLAKL